MGHKQNELKAGEVFGFFKALLVVLLVLFLVFFFSPFFYEGGQRTKAMHALDSSHLRQIAVMMYAYAENHGGTLPSHPHDAESYLPHERNPRNSVWFNPFQEERVLTDRDRSDESAFRYRGYVYLNLGLVVDDIDEPNGLILAYTAKVSPKQKVRNVLFADGHTERWGEKQLREALPPEIDVDALDGP